MSDPLSYYTASGYSALGCECSSSETRIKPSQCRTDCTEPSYGLNGTLRKITQKRIWHRVRVPQSLYLSEKASLNVVGGKDNYSLRVVGETTDKNWNQMSDRAVAHKQVANVPSRGNSTKKTITRNRPGASTPGGTGVDVKHNSYSRYLARKKAGNVVTRPAVPNAGFDYNLARTVITNPKITKGNKLGTFGIVEGGYQCPCNPFISSIRANILQLEHEILVMQAINRPLSQPYSNVDGIRPSVGSGSTIRWGSYTMSAGVFRLWTPTSTSPEDGWNSNALILNNEYVYPTAGEAMLTSNPGTEITLTNIIMNKNFLSIRIIADFLTKSSAIIDIILSVIDTTTGEPVQSDLFTSKQYSDGEMSILLRAYNKSFPNNSSSETFYWDLTDTNSSNELAYNKNIETFSSSDPSHPNAAWAYWDMLNYLLNNPDAYLKIKFILS